MPHMANLPWLQLFTVGMSLMIFTTCLLTNIKQKKMLNHVNMTVKPHSSQKWMW